jgi:hypothetical protein
MFSVRCEVNLHELYATKDSTVSGRTFYLVWTLLDGRICQIGIQGD